MFKYLETLYIRCYYSLAKFYVSTAIDNELEKELLSQLELLKTCLRKVPQSYFLHCQLVPIALGGKKLELAYASACAAKMLAQNSEAKLADLLLIRCYIANRQFDKAEQIFLSFDLNLDSTVNLLEQGIAIYMALENKVRVKELLSLISVDQRTSEIKLIEDYLDLSEVR